MKKKDKLTRLFDELREHIKDEEGQLLLDNLIEELIKELDLIEELIKELDLMLQIVEKK